MNIEYRCNLISILKGAVFVDAGNVWLLKDDPLRPGGLFEINDFINELAVGTGVGLRADANFFVIRLDLAFPLPEAVASSCGTGGSLIRLIS